MRKINLLTISLLITALLVACTSESESAQPGAASTYIEVTNNSAQQITSIEVKLYQKEMVQASPTAMNEDESLIGLGESIEIGILKQDINFDEPVIIEVVAMINGVERSTGRTESMQLMLGNNYQFEVVGGQELQLSEIEE